jgi:transcriptional regulator with XRE-family HTH domain
MRGTGKSDGFATRLQRERCVRGWTQQEPIDRLKRLAFEQGDGHRFDGLDSNTLSHYEHGHIRRPRAPLRALFAALYEVRVAELFPNRTPIVPAPREPPITLLHGPAGPWTAAAKSDRVVLTVEELPGSSPTPPCRLFRRACQCSYTSTATQRKRRDLILMPA